MCRVWNHQNQTKHTWSHPQHNNFIQTSNCYTVGLEPLGEGSPLNCLVIANPFACTIFHTLRHLCILHPLNCLYSCMCSGVVEFASYADMKNAIEKLDGAELNGRRIRISEDKRRGAAGRKSRSSSRSRSRSRGGGYHRRSKSQSRSRSRSRSRRSSHSRSKSRDAASKSRSRSR